MLETDRKRQKEEFAAMKREEKIAYIWNYYKWAIVAASVILLGIVYTIATPPKPKNEISVNVTFIGEWVNQSGADDFAVQLNEALPNLGNENDRIDVQTYSLGESADPMMVMANSQKLAANIMASEIDVVIGDEIQLKKYANEEAFIPLSEIYSQEELAELDLVSSPVEYINLSGKKAISAVLSYEKIGMVLMANSPHKEKAREVMDYLLSLD